ncbi:MAG: hypothetical protein V3R94_06410 [Acidobacteriota bacterium]
MKKAFIIAALGLLAMGILFYILIANSERSTHLHFTTRGGVFKNVVYYSATPPEFPSQHTCDGKFAEMRDDLYETHLQLWREKYDPEAVGSR